MSSYILKILLTIYILYALLKFFEFFFRSDEAKMKGLRAVYSGGGRGNDIDKRNGFVMHGPLVMRGGLGKGGRAGQQSQQ